MGETRERGLHASQFTLIFAMPLTRRRFCTQVGLGLLGAGLVGPRFARGAAGEVVGAVSPGGARPLFEDLLREWGEGLLAHQYQDPARPAEFGAFRCPSCSFIHGRGMDAVYPLMHLARKTGDERFQRGALAALAWSENVSQPDGSWTVIVDPRSWKGITVFGATALAEALHHHGDFFPAAERTRWRARLRQAMEFIAREFHLHYSNVNYCAAATYALQLGAAEFGHEPFARRARELFDEVAPLFTTGGLLAGETKPVEGRSARGLSGVDLGYNAEESLVALTLYAVGHGGEHRVAMLERAWAAHLHFMLPEGGWDNSFGTRHAKWSYWGSRTCDGAQPGLAALAGRQPAFATAAIRNTELMRACTRDGLLHGGPHYAAHGAPPCIHHTFTHAKALAAVLDQGALIDHLTATAPLPRATADGVREFPEIATWLAARGPWRATVTTYDHLYRKDVRQATGGTLALLWHEAVGAVGAASMARYVKVEVNNMQDPVRGRDDTLTPRIECRDGARVYSQLFDLNARVTVTDEDKVIRFSGICRPCTEAGEVWPGGEVQFQYELGAQGCTWSVRMDGAVPAGAMLVWPLIAAPDEPARQPGPDVLEIVRAGGVVRLTANTPLPSDRVRERVFSLTPGFAAIEARCPLRRDGGTLVCRLQITPASAANEMAAT